tara:strand:- start:2088 stop:2729 length:642 start_codon:yes stop_codon:yes gene_type:complete
MVAITCILAICTAYINDVKTVASSTDFTIAYSSMLCIACLLILLQFFGILSISRNKKLVIFALTFLGLNMLIMYISAIAENKHMIPILTATALTILFTMSFVGLKTKNLTSWGGPLYTGLLLMFLGQIILLIMMLTTNIPINTFNIMFNILMGISILIFTLYIAYDVNKYVKHCNTNLKICCEDGTFLIWDDFANILRRLISSLADTEFNNIY